MSSRAFTAVRLPIIVSNSTDRVYAESKRLTRRVTAEQSEGAAFVCVNKIKQMLRSTGDRSGKSELRRKLQPS